MAKSNVEGELDGLKMVEECIRSSADWYDIRSIEIGASTDEEIAIATVFGAGTVCKQILNTTNADGVVLVKTRANGANGFVSLPVKAGIPSGKLPAITHIKKTGSMAGVVIRFLQRINQ